MRSSLQNVNIHRTPEDALQTVPPHLWPPALTQRGCTRPLSLFLSVSLCPCWTSVVVSLFWSALSMQSVDYPTDVPPSSPSTRLSLSLSLSHTHFFVFCKGFEEFSLDTLSIWPQCSFMKATQYMYVPYIFLSFNHVVSSNDHVTFSYMCQHVCVLSNHCFMWRCIQW